MEKDDLDRLVDLPRDQSSWLTLILEPRVDEFLDWLGENTDFGDWGLGVKIEVRKKLVEILMRRI